MVKARLPASPWRLEKRGWRSRGVVFIMLKFSSLDFFFFLYFVSWCRKRDFDMRDFEFFFIIIEEIAVVLYRKTPVFLLRWKKVTLHKGDKGFFQLLESMDYFLSRIARPPLNKSIKGPYGKGGKKQTRERQTEPKNKNKWTRERFVQNNIYHWKKNHGSFLVWVTDELSDSWSWKLDGKRADGLFAVVYLFVC